MPPIGVKTDFLDIFSEQRSKGIYSETNVCIQSWSSHMPSQFSLNHSKFSPSFRFLPQLVRFSFQLQDGQLTSVLVKLVAAFDVILIKNPYPSNPSWHRSFSQNTSQSGECLPQKKKIIINKTSFSRRPQCLETSDFLSDCTDLIPRPMLGLLI